MISVCRVVYGDITCRHSRASPPRRSPRGGGELSRTAAGARGGVSVARHPPLNAPRDKIQGASPSMAMDQVAKSS